MRALAASGAVSEVVLLVAELRTPLNTDEAIAKAALHEAVKLALGPGNKRSKMAALKVVLDYTKPKPAERRAIKAEGPGAGSPCDPERWLRAVLADDQL
jgi:hypothetical protein